MGRITGKALACGAAAVALLAAVATTGKAAEPAAYEVHAVLSLTGGGAFLGTAERRALELLEKLQNQNGGIHGKPVHFVFTDDQSTPQMAVQGTTDALAGHPAVIIGSSLVASCNAMSPLVRQGPMMYCLSPGIHPPKGSFAYTSSVSTGDYSAALLQFFRLKGWHRLAVMTSTDATGQDAENGLDKLLALPQNKDLQVVARAHFNTNDVSVAAQVATIKAAQPQVLIAWSTGSPIGTIFRGLVQAGFDIPVATTGGNMTYAQMHQFAAFLPKQLYMPSSEWPAAADPKLGLDPRVLEKQKAFYGAFAAAGEKPDEGNVLAWDPGLLILDALNQLPAGADAATLNAHFQTLQNQAGVGGIYNYVKAPQRGIGLEDTIVTLWNAKTQHWDVVSKPSGVPLAP